jgi:Adenylate and Guanylate cyclase catalytic domain/Double zinc ribbon
VTCASCGSENRPGARFCRTCGASLSNRCPECGAAFDQGQRFCDSCGTRLEADTPPPPPPRLDPVSERRLVSVLFADLVGFTALSESRDAEEVRELLSRYFDTCRRLVERYGGTVEKFIGDAVMAVWGTPTANEDDAERAVRTALDLVAAVAGVVDELGIAELRLRAGVLTGEAAEAAFDLDDLERVEALLVATAELPLIQRRDLLVAQTARLSAKLAARRGQPTGDSFEVAAERFRELEMPFWAAVAQQEAECLLEAGRDDEAAVLLAGAGSTFERLRAEPWSRRVQRAERERDTASVAEQ